MIKLTNASEGYSGNVLYLNPAHIVSMYEDISSVVPKTLIYGGPTGSTWTVMESMEEVFGLINSNLYV